MFMTVFFSFLVFLGMLVVLNEGDIILDYIWAIYNDTFLYFCTMINKIIDVTVIFILFFN